MKNLKLCKNWLFERKSLSTTIWQFWHIVFVQKILARKFAWIKQ